jgi:ATP-binding cassette, subfamily B, bacterial MsbA
MASTFGILNFALLQPLLDILFSKDPIQLTPKPSFEFSIAYFSAFFNHTLTTIATQNGKVQALWFVCGVIVSSVFLSNIFRYLSTRIIEKVKGLTVAQLRQAVFEKTIHLHLGFFSTEKKGNIIAHMTTDIQEVENSVGKTFTALFKESFQLVFFFGTLFYKSVELTLFSLIVIPISGVIIGSLSKKLRESAKDVQQKQGNLFSILDETFGGIRVVKGFNAETFIKQKFKDENYSYFHSWLKLVFRQESASPMSEFLGVVTVAGILIYGGSLVLAGHSDMSASSFITYIILFSQVTRPAKEISNAISGVQRGVAAAERILGLIDTPNPIQDKANPIEIESFNQEIEFKNVGFAYNENLLLWWVHQVAANQQLRI